jgi:hypothetical protein
MHKVCLKDITDGVSKTALILERAALPDRYFQNGSQVELHDPPAYRTFGNVGLWAISGEKLLSYLQIEGNMRIVNGDNLHGLYSFHPGGAQVAIVDGSVQFIAESIETKTMLALISRDGGEVIDSELSW